MRLKFTARDTILFHNFRSMRSFFKRKKALESSHSHLSNVFFRLKNDLLEQKLWAILVNRFLGVKSPPMILPKCNCVQNVTAEKNRTYYLYYLENKTLKRKEDVRLSQMLQNGGDRVPHIVRTPNNAPTYFYSPRNTWLGMPISIAKYSLRVV